MWISYPRQKKEVDKQWISYVIWGITFCPFAFIPGDVDKLSTVNVDNFESYPPPHNNVDKLSTVHVDNFKGYPPLHDTVENLSTTVVDKSGRIKQAEKTRQLLHNSEELSTISSTLSTFYSLRYI